MSKPKVAIIGMGRFGQILLKLLRNDFSITVFGRSQKKLKAIPNLRGIKKTTSIAEALKNDVVFYTVPIGKFEAIIKSHQPYLSPRHLIIDTLSVKMHPAEVLRKIKKKTGARALLTHPLFGPDSAKNGFRGLGLVMDKSLASRADARFWKRFFESKGLRVVEMSARDHDRLAANSQGLTHFIGRLLSQFEFGSTQIDTLGALKLREIMEQTCNDTWELFYDLQTLNPFTAGMRMRLESAFDRLSNKLLPVRAKRGKVTFGIQGGQGSFNEQAMDVYIKEKQIPNAKVKYLFTTKKVLSALHRGQIDLGVFAIANSRGGLVDESLAALGKFKFEIVGRMVVHITHHLMKRKDVKATAISVIMAHDQVFRQCAENLTKNHPDKKLISGKGDLIDTAKAAEALSLGRIPKTTAILGSAKLAELFNLEIIENDLQDDPKNKTTFLVVKR